jgi:hypothetical protein
VKPYILNYSEVMPITSNGLVFDDVLQTNKRYLVDSTVRTLSVEGGDEDSLLVSDTTLITKSMESNDSDCILASDSTLITDSVEGCDEDSLILFGKGDGVSFATESRETDDEDMVILASESTLVTRSIESSDADISLN